MGSPWSLHADISNGVGWEGSAWVKLGKSLTLREMTDYSQQMNTDDIAAVRRFSRAVTQRVGIFTDRFLGRGRPLAEARLIFEIGREGQSGRDVRQLRTLLDLDSGYLSRLLRSLERQGLVEVRPGEEDRRVRRVHLTAQGAGEFEALNRLGDELAESILQPLSTGERQRLVVAMIEVEQLLCSSATKIDLEDPASTDAQKCLEHYVTELSERFRDGFDSTMSLSADPDEMRLPRGAFLVARLDGRAIGCGALKLLEPGMASIKRMWVDGSFRGLGLGRRILTALESQARELDVTILRLETNRDLGGADAFYRRNGYREVAPFNEDPYADFWFEKRMELENT